MRLPDLTNQIGEGYLRRRALDAAVLETLLSFQQRHRSVDCACPAQRINAKATARIESPETSSSDSELEEYGTSPTPMVDSWLHSFGNGLPSLE